MLIFFGLGLAAHATTLTLTVHPDRGDAMTCTLADAVPGELYAGPRMVMGDARVTPLFVIERVSRHGAALTWDTRLKVETGSLIKMAHPDGDRKPRSCGAEVACAIRYDRGEQSMTLQAVFAPITPDIRPDSPRPTWDSQSWYRSPRAVPCQPTAHLRTPAPATE